MKLGIHLGNNGSSATAASLATLAARAEELGYDSVWTSDHVVIPSTIAGEQPSGRPGVYDPADLENYWEAFSVLAFVAGMTKRVELGVTVIWVEHVMKAIMETAMRGGAMGMTTALIYPPSSYAKTEELIEMAKVAAKYGGVYASHIRGEGKELVESVTEAIQIGERAGLPVEQSPVLLVTLDIEETVSLWSAVLRALGDPYWDVGYPKNLMKRAIKLLAKRPVEMIIVDEFNHSVDRGQARLLMNTIKEILNAGIAPVVVMGTDEEIESCDYTHFPYHRYRGSGEIDITRALPLLWDKEPDAEGMFVVAFSDGSARALDREGLDRALKR